MFSLYEICMFNQIFVCPKIELKKQERINFIIRNILAFLTNDKLISLIKKCDNISINIEQKR